MKILVIGGTGKVGSEVVKELRKRGAELRLLTRTNENPGQMPGVELVKGDLLDPASMETAFSGIDKLYLLNAVIPDELTQAVIAYDLAKKHRLRHILYHSVFRPERLKDVPHGASKWALESVVKEFDLPYTIIRPNYFFQNDEALKESLTKDSIYPIPLGPVGLSAVDVRDIAEASAIALTGHGHEAMIYNLVGPQLLSGPTVAQIWSRLLNKEVKYGGHDLDHFEEQSRQKMPAWSAFDLRMMFQACLERGMEAQPGDVDALTKLLGHSPRRYQDFARETLETWKA